MKKDMNFIVIASDGIWEFLDNKKVGEIVKNFYLNGTAKEAAEEIVKKNQESQKKEDNHRDRLSFLMLRVIIHYLFLLFTHFGQFIIYFI